MKRVLFFFYTDSSGVFAKNVQTANGWASLKYVCRLASRLSFPFLFDFETLLFLPLLMFVHMLKYHHFFLSKDCKITKWFLMKNQLLLIFLTNLHSFIPSIYI